MFQKLKNIYHLLRALIANIYFGFPSRRLKVVGVTGTDGKTTTTHLIYHILKETDHKVSMISTVFAKIGKQEYDTGFHVTTPDAFLIPKYLNMAVSLGQEYFVLEVTSHRLDQNQLFGTSFEIGVITNITHEHLDYHKTYKNYVKAKEKLLSMAKIGIINEDDESFKYLSQKSKVKSQNYNSKVKSIKRIPNLTLFNQCNYSAAYTVCKQLGLSDNQILTAIKTFKLPKGRLEIVYDKEFKVIIDFAHTPNAFHQLLPEIKKLFFGQFGRLIHVFGSAGLRDVSKRPLMGKASGQYADLVILTEEDYRIENPNQISSAIASGLEKEGFRRVYYNFSKNYSKQSYFVILNRQKAINTAIKLARKGDVVIITGKGHEKSLCRGKIEYPWDEYKAVVKALKILNFKY